MDLLNIRSVRRRSEMHLPVHLPKCRLAQSGLLANLTFYFCIFAAFLRFHYSNYFLTLVICSRTHPLLTPKEILPGKVISEVEKKGNRASAEHPHLPTPLVVR